MGAWLVRQHSLDDADQAQRHYEKLLLRRGAYDRGWFERLFPADHASQLEEEDRSDMARAGFFGAARVDFGKTPWVSWLAP